MKRPKSKSLSAKETRRILETTQHKVSDELSRACLCQVFDLDTGGSLLLFENGKGRLYKSADELRALISEVELQARKGPTSIASELLPQGHAFADQIQQLISQLGTLFKTDSGQLDASEASLNKVDEGLRKLRRQQLLTPEVFAPLTAYVGEVIRTKAMSALSPSPPPACKSPYLRITTAPGSLKIGNFFPPTFSQALCASCWPSTLRGTSRTSSFAKSSLCRANSRSSVMQ